MKARYQLAEHRNTGGMHIVRSIPGSLGNPHTYCGQEVRPEIHRVFELEADLLHDASVREHWQQEFCNRCMQAVLKEMQEGPAS